MKICWKQGLKILGKNRLGKILWAVVGHTDRSLRLIFNLIIEKTSFIFKTNLSSSYWLLLKMILTQSVLIQYMKPEGTSHHPNNLRNMDLSKTANAKVGMELTTLLSHYCPMAMSSLASLWNSSSLESLLSIGHQYL